MSDLRAAVRELYSEAETWLDTEFWVDGEPYIRADAVLALIPEGSVLVNEETLAAALPQAVNFRVPVALPVTSSAWTTIAAAILAQLRETP